MSSTTWAIGALYCIHTVLISTTNTNYIKFMKREENNTGDRQLSTVYKAAK